MSFAILPFILLVSSLDLAFGQRQELDQEEYQQKLEYLNSRYKDFYLHRKARERRRRNQLDAADTYRKIRKMREQIREKRRKAYVIKRHQAPTSEDHKPQYLKKLEKRKKIRKKNQRDYVRRRKALEAIRQSVRHIPENEESGLVDPLENFPD